MGFWLKCYPQGNAITKKYLIFCTTIQSIPNSKDKQPKNGELLIIIFSQLLDKLCL